HILLNRHEKRVEKYSLPLLTAFHDIHGRKSKEFTPITRTCLPTSFISVPLPFRAELRLFSGRSREISVTLKPLVFPYFGHQPTPTRKRCLPASRRPRLLVDLTTGDKPTSRNYLRPKPLLGTAYIGSSTSKLK